MFYQLVTSYSVTEPIERLTSWLYTVAKNKVIDWYRKRRTSALPADDESGRPLNLEDVLFDPTDSPDEMYARSVVWRELVEALDELPEEQRQVFVLHELEGKSFKEIAEQTAEPMSTLLSRKRYAVMYLRDRLREMYEELYMS